MIETSIMEASELIALAEVEDRYWWYKERRSILAKELRRLPQPGTALDIGAAGGGNTRVLRAHGWKSMALEYTSTAAKIAHDRGIDVVRGDARELPVRTGSVDLVTAFDVLEHIEEDYLATAEITRVLRPGGPPSSPCPRTWRFGPLTMRPSVTFAGTTGPGCVTSSSRAAW